MHAHNIYIYIYILRLIFNRDLILSNNLFRKNITKIQPMRMAMCLIGLSGTKYVFLSMSICAVENSDKVNRNNTTNVPITYIIFSHIFPTFSNSTASPYRS